jgi:hypothetical protein
MTSVFSLLVDVTYFTGGCTSFNTNDLSIFDVINDKHRFRSTISKLHKLVFDHNVVVFVQTPLLTESLMRCFPSLP